ncbi:MAG: KEOPS complex N(6)-L-threonylcarbamoyladenine synthase Kae1 [Nitrososphaera sp.]
MLCLGIESTAHTFGCAVVDNKGRILSDARDVYRPPSGSGIHPREASRHHAECSSRIVSEALSSAGIGADALDIVAFAAGPGLGPCLRVGAVTARALSGFHNKPLVPVNHALGHVELGCLLTGAEDPLVLLVSGGHTMILLFSMQRWRVFGETLDITIGQLLDQFGRSLGYASPCGMQIEQLAFVGEKSNKFLHLPYVVKGNDVSFSGILTAAKELHASGSPVSDVAFSLQETAFAMLAEVVERAVAFTSKKELLVVGGVAANKRLATMLEGACAGHGCKVLACPIKFAGDNGAQIAWTGIQDFAKNQRSVEIRDSGVRQSWRLDRVNVSWRQDRALAR